MGSSRPSRLDESRIASVCKVSDVLRVLVVLGVCFHCVKMRFPFRSGVEHGGAHDALEVVTSGEPEWSCAMEVASLARVEMRTKKGKIRKQHLLEGSERAYLKLVSWCHSELVSVDWSNLFFSLVTLFER